MGGSNVTIHTRDKAEIVSHLQFLNPPLDQVIDHPMFEKCLSSVGKAFYRSACIVDVCLTDIPRFNMATGTMVE